MATLTPADTPAAAENAVRMAPPCAIVIFGATGDLTRRKLMPALFSLARMRRLAPETQIVGVSVSALSDEQFRGRVSQDLATFAPEGGGEDASDAGQAFLPRLSYVSGKFDDPGLFQRLRERLQELKGTGQNVLFYLATPPSLFGPLAKQLCAAGLTHPEAPGAWTRLIVEKPFGRDLASARALNQELHECFAEEQIYRIDHYLGKETVRNLIVFRFANGIFEPIWNRRYVDHVQLTVAESLGIERRGRYYEEAGALRDMIENHLMQVLSIMAMEAPVRFEANAVRDEKVKLVRSIRPLAPDGNFDRVAVRGQYGPGVIEGQAVPGYRQEADVAPHSNRETWAAIKLEIENWRWAGVPFYLRSGKRMPKRVSEIAIRFKAPPFLMFQDVFPEAIDANVLVIRIQPDEGIALRFEAKVPGTDMRLRPVNMEFKYGVSFGEPQPEAYETLLLDAMIGDGMLFARYDQVEAAWELITPLLQHWESSPAPEFPNYAAGQWGPEAADAFLAADGRHWRKP